MKKTLIALAVSGVLSLGSVAYAAEAGTGYVGAKVGWSHTETPTRRHAETVMHDGNNSWDFGLYGGYNITKFFGLEAGYDYLGKFSNKGTYKGVNLGDYTVHGAELAALLAVPFNETDDVFLKLGALIANTADDAFDHTQTKTVPLLGIGTRIAFGDFIGRLEYNYAHKFAKLNKYGYAPDLSTLNAGLEWKFGGYTPAPVVAAPAPEEPKTVVVDKSVTLDSTALFGFNKATLSNEGKQSIANVTNEINSNNIQDVQIKVEGHTDRIGSEKYNMDLSKKRARAVVEEFVADGVDPSSITAEGYGESRPVTGNKCDGIKNRKELVNCLAPDRRVEVKFSGVKQVEEQQ